MSKQTYNSHFQDCWLTDPQFVAWIKKHPTDETKARCVVCAKDVNVAKHGIKDLERHAEGKKHNERLPKDTQSSIVNSFKSVNNESSSSSKSSESQAAPAMKQTTITACTNQAFVVQSEIMWCLDVILNNYSYNSSSNKSDLFSKMFPDSKVAQDFAVGKTKCSYVIKYGIAPYFLELLNQQLEECPFYVALFDESYNRIAKENQMDMHIRYWDTNENIVATRYYNSDYLGKSSAKDVFEKFNNCFSPLQKDKLLQISSDGPNVNLSFLEMVKDNRKEEELPKLIDLGTCGLHTIHNGFKHGEKASGWFVNKFLTALYKIFDQAPGRRADYKNVTQATDQDFPMQFVSHRWVENEPVAKKANIVWPKVKVVTEYWKTLPKSKQPGLGKPGANTSYDRLCSTVSDPLISLKVLFFEQVAKKLNDFLVLFQTDKPMAPFLAESLEELLRYFMDQFILKRVLEKASTQWSLIKLDPLDRNNRKPVKEVDLGFAVNLQISTLKTCSKGQ